MKKKYVMYSFAFIIIVAVSFFAGYNYNRLTEDVSLKNKIIQKTKKSDTIDFSQITDFEWDTMYIFTPYSSPKDIFKSNGIKSCKSNFSIEYLDSINMIAFVKSNKLVDYVELPRNYGGVELTSPREVTKESAKFQIDTKSNQIIFKQEPGL